MYIVKEYFSVAQQTSALIVMLTSEMLIVMGNKNSKQDQGLICTNPHVLFERYYIYNVIQEEQVVTTSWAHTFSEQKSLKYVSPKL